MYNPLSTPHERSEPLPRWLWIASIILALVISLSTDARGQNNDSSTNPNANSNADGAIGWMSGGIGSEARDEMRQAAPNYNVHLMFSGRQGHYLANIPYTVEQQGKKFHAGVSNGPLLYLKLPPGTYVISADLNGDQQQKRITVGSGARVSKASFIARE